VASFRHFLKNRMCCRSRRFGHRLLLVALFFVFVMAVVSVQRSARDLRISDRKVTSIGEGIDWIRVNTYGSQRSIHLALGNYNRHPLGHIRPILIFYGISSANA
jgi:hypothetical protein